MEKKLNKFEKSRLLGARALELSKGAKPKIDIEKEGINIMLSRDLIKVAQIEYDRGLLDLKVINQ
ncbi:MAG: DNA-directed RNA polymerase subunit omega [Nanoarchaeota archaeon]|nr:DNA-directed RNA polymerase subunit omega [Nanoarchaeota archaeon]